MGFRPMTAAVPHLQPAIADVLENGTKRAGAQFVSGWGLKRLRYKLRHRRRRNGVCVEVSYMDMAMGA